jgi:tol-pal system protein YbgF
MVRPPSLVPLAALAALAALSGGFALGCASTQDRHAAELSSSVAKLQADQDRAFDAVKAEEPGPPPPPRADKPGEKRPLLLTNPEEGIGDIPAADDPDDTTPRPVIRVTGVPFRTAGRGKTVVRGNDRVESSGADEPSGPEPKAQPSALDPEARKTYERALGLVQAKKYAEGIEALSAFMAKYPDHPYVENATYWKGEAYFAQGDHARAAAEFESIATRSALGIKTPDALLKLGMSQEKLGQPDKARASYERLLREFPKSEAARRVPTAPGKADGPAPRGPR